jgi:hypothetical protein
MKKRIISKVNHICLVEPVLLPAEGMGNIFCNPISKYPAIMRGKNPQKQMQICRRNTNLIIISAHP